MQSGTYNPSIRPCPAIALLVSFLGAATACAQPNNKPPLVAVIKEGQQFAHRIRIPSSFKKSSQDKGTLLFDRYAFRVAPSVPDVLLVGACRYEVLSEHKYEMSTYVCSANSFAIDSSHSYAVREAKPSEWAQSTPIDGFLEMADPYRRTLKEEIAKPAFLRPVPIGPEEESEGYRYRGKEYRRRANWISALNFGASPDGKLVVLAGFDRHHLYSDGAFTIDIFEADPRRRLVQLDVSYQANNRAGVEDWLRQVSLVNSRWFAIGLDFENLQDMLLFDFKPAVLNPVSGTVSGSAGQ